MGKPTHPSHSTLLIEYMLNNKPTGSAKTSPSLSVTCQQMHDHDGWKMCIPQQETPSVPSPSTVPGGEQSTSSPPAMQHHSPCSAPWATLGQWQGRRSWYPRLISAQLPLKPVADIHPCAGLSHPGKCPASGSAISHCSLGAAMSSA